MEMNYVKTYYVLSLKEYEMPDGYTECTLVLHSGVVGGHQSCADIEFNKVVEEARSTMQGLFSKIKSGQYVDTSIRVFIYVPELRDSAVVRDIEFYVERYRSVTVNKLVHVWEGEKTKECSSIERYTGGFGKIHEAISRRRPSRYRLRDGRCYDI